MIRLLAIFLVTVFVKLFYRHKVVGVKNIPKGSAIMAANHASYLDPPLVGISSPWSIVHFLARKSLFDNWLFGWLLRQLCTHPVERGGKNIETFRLTIELLKKGKKVAIFPEGSRTPDGTLQPGQAGVGMLVKKAGCPVVPVYVHGTYAVWSIHRKKPKLKGRTAIVYGKPLTFDKEDKQEIADAIMAAIAQLREDYLSSTR